MRVKLAWLARVGVHGHPLSLHLPSPVKLQRTLQLLGRYTDPVSSLPIYVLCGGNPCTVQYKHSEVSQYTNGKSTFGFLEELPLL
jgi:hypothetical protein